MNGALDQIIMGLWHFSLDKNERVVDEAHVPTFSFLKTSLTAPPDTERNAEPANPVRKRKIICTAALLAGHRSAIDCEIETPSRTKGNGKIEH